MKSRPQKKSRTFRKRAAGRGRLVRFGRSQVGLRRVRLVTGENNTEQVTLKTVYPTIEVHGDQGGILQHLRELGVLLDDIYLGPEHPRCVVVAPRVLSEKQLDSLRHAYCIELHNRRLPHQSPEIIACKMTFLQNYRSGLQPLQRLQKVELHDLIRTLESQKRNGQELIDKREAAKRLGDMGAKAKPAIRSLIAASHSSDITLANLSLRALEAIRSEGNN